MNNKKHLINSIIRWFVIIIAVIIVYILKKEQLVDAFHEIIGVPWWINFLMLIMAFMYFIFEGRIISDMTGIDGEKSLSWLRGIFCSFYCEFYRLLTIGSATAVAQIFYYDTYGVKPARATGLCLVQYTVQKFAICILGIFAYIWLIAAGQPEMIKYSKWILIGILLNVIIVTVLIIIAVSENMEKFSIRLINKFTSRNKKASGNYNKITAENSNDNAEENNKNNSAINKKNTKHEKKYKAAKLIDQIECFHREGKTIYRDKRTLWILLMDILKQLSWYTVPAIFFCYLNGGNAAVYLAIMAVTLLLSGVMGAPAGVGTLEYVFNMLFKPLVGKTAVSGVIMYRFYVWFIPFFVGAAVAAARKKPVKTDQIKV